MYFPEKGLAWPTPKPQPDKGATSRPPTRPTTRASNALQESASATLTTSLVLKHSPYHQQWQKSRPTSSAPKYTSSPNAKDKPAHEPPSRHRPPTPPVTISPRCRRPNTRLHVFNRFDMALNVSFILLNVHTR
ncbi:hypothetical protein X797_009825 [Metarhizium robertsii]|uniref:Uncharacterized protein n=1 Tax=Metarhizium robertsii TaxID=568076 RepID=A0A0A1UQ66_9HYPO|nr:hypothetical protein X797_009825 [Metarhizium robertsii]